MSLNVPFFLHLGDGKWLSRTMARGGQSSVSKNRSSGSDVERSLLREWGWRGPAHLLYKWRRLFRPRRRDLGFGRASNCYEEVARRHRNWYFQHFNQLLLWIKIYYIALCLLCKVYFSAQPNKLRPILKFKKYYPIEHIFVPACSSVLKIHFFKF